MGKRVSQLDAMTTIENADLLYGVDVDDLTHSPEGTSKKFTKQNLLKEINSRAGDIESDVSDLESAVANILNLVYPVGSIYTNATDDTNPGTLLGVGTWEAFASGRVLVGKASSGTFATAGATGGAETHTLTASQSGLRSHRHQLRLGSPLGVGGYNDKVGRVNQATSSDDDFRTGLAYSPTSSYGSEGYGSASLDNANATESHNNLQPYIVVYMWKRVS